MTEEQQRVMRTTLLQFIVKWKEGFGLPAWAELSNEQALLCQNEWMASEEFGKLYGWRLEPQNDGQRRVYDELIQHKARLEEELKKETTERRLKIMKGESGE